MSEKMTCPACQSHTSSILSAFSEGRDCPSCGLAADVAWDVQRHRNRAADQSLTDEMAKLGQEVGALRKENRELRRALMEVQNAMEDVQIRPFTADEIDVFGR